VAEPGHQFFDSRACCRRERPADVSKIVEMQIRNASRGRGTVPDRSEVGSAQASALWPDEYQSLGAWLGEALQPQSGQLTSPQCTEGGRQRQGVMADRESSGNREDDRQRGNSPLAFSS
jgi:hypothetical protein